jgi:DHA2 family multidrug resistance protein
MAHPTTWMWFVYNAGAIRCLRVRRRNEGVHETIPMTQFWFNSKAIVTYAVSLLALAEIIDLTIVSVAIPQMMGALGADIDSIAMVTTSYIVAAAVFIPLTGLVIRKYGMKRIFLLSATLFTISSVLCGIATSLPQMICFRILQGVGGAFLPSLAQSYIAQTYSGKDRENMMSLFGLIIVMGPVLGPVLGGALSENLSWRWIFYVNVPICGLGFLLALVFMEKENIEDVKIDYISFLFMAMGIGFLEYFIDEGNRHLWLHSIEMIIILAIALLSLTFFIWRGLLGKSVINFRLFTNFNFIMSCFAIFMFTMIMTGALAYFPTMLQQIYRYPVDTAGYITAPRGIAAIISAPLIPLIVRRIGMKMTMFTGMTTFTLSCFMLANFAPAVSRHHILITVIIQGFAMMAFYIPIMQICFVGFSEALSTDVSGVFNFFRNFSCSVGNSICATIISHQSQINYHNLSSHISPYANGFIWWQQRLPHLSEQLQVGIAEAKILAQGLFLSYLHSYYFFGFLLLCLLWIPFTLKQPAIDDQSHHQLLH